MSVAKISTGTAVGLALGMLITGSLNSLTAEWADRTWSQGRYIETKFNHPFFQAYGMFIGETLCLLAFGLNNFYLSRSGQGDRIERASGDYKFYIFALPACCDMMGTSLMYLGLTYTAVSTFQMLRGAVMIFTGIFSVLFLGRKLYSFHWFGMILVVMGLGCVGVSSILFGNSNDAKNPILGDALVVAAQLVAATQMVIEEKFLDKYKVPALQAVGMEGCFGMFFLGILLVIFQNIPGLPDSGDANHFEDSIDAFHQLGNNKYIMMAFVGNIFSIAFFNFFGLSVTKHLSATTRMVLDSIRTLTVWGAALALGWEDFQYLQVVGFVFLLVGTAVYNKIIYVPIAFLDYRLYAMLEEQQAAQQKLLATDSTDSQSINLHAPLIGNGHSPESNELPPKYGSH